MATDSNKQVHIRQDGSVDNEWVDVSRSAREEVVWFSDSDEFSVQFPTTPFEEDTFQVPAKGNASSGPVRLDAPIAEYQYRITNVALAKSADPGLNVKP